MSVQPQGPGWWQASDGRWYPPQSWQPQPSQPQPRQPGQQPWQQPGPQGPPRPVPRKSGGKGWVIAAVVVVLVLAGIGVGGFFALQGLVSNVAGIVPGLGAPPSCLPTAEVSTVVGSAVKDPQSGSLVGSTGCAYFAVDQQAGVDVNIVTGPELVADDQLESHSGEARAAGVEPEPIPVGQRGQAWNHELKSSAMTVSGGRLLAVEIMSASGMPIGDRQAQAVELLGRLVG